MNIFLVGFMGTGKSTLARTLQKVYGLQLIEMDEKIAEQEGKSIQDIFSQSGERYFRDLETLFLKKICKQQNLVVSCGGGVVLRKENVEMMKECGTLICLTATPETVLNRVKYSEDRPLLQGKKTVEDIAQLMKAREERYKAADFFIATDEKSAHEIAEEIVQKINLGGNE